MKCKFILQMWSFVLCVKKNCKSLIKHVLTCGCRALLRSSPGQLGIVGEEEVLRSACESPAPSRQQAVRKVRIGRLLAAFVTKIKKLAETLTSFSYPQDRRKDQNIVRKCDNMFNIHYRDKEIVAD